MIDFNEISDFLKLLSKDKKFMFLFKLSNKIDFDLFILNNTLFKVFDTLFDILLNYFNSNCSSICEVKRFDKKYISDVHFSHTIIYNNYSFTRLGVIYNGNYNCKSYELIKIKEVN